MMSDFKTFLNDYTLNFAVKGELDLNRLKKKHNITDKELEECQKS